MPITARKPNECFETFRSHLGKVLAATLGDTHPVLYRQEGRTKAALTLGSPESLAGVRLSSAKGNFLFSLRQNLEAVSAPDGKFQLKTRGYRYAISESDDELAEALMRWEFTSHGPAGKQCKHHFQMGRVGQKAITAPFHDGTLDLNRLHTPTGFVLIEYVLRFLLTDMGVKSACASWEQILDESEGKFFTEFSGRTS